MAKQYKPAIGLRVNYGAQAWYRGLGIEMRCGICRHFEGELVHLDDQLRICARTGRACLPGDICLGPERAPGADDEDPSPLKKS